ncbi:metallophosphoesterase [Rhodococcus triatomae]|uniref:Calcineurin-like phosphoesterase domain-containing protein n=1 Tax=Rhodococcus triatomae TaxID=300028 RepID=A0A1G8P8L9_9NOCA|nr:metallophosphoesterase [Rhodococcus triatomae]QNG18718.1 metallophosphoesterase [Rhodococcus triatomae]QNG25372.1 metallophosphoesterase [Rhodococcus triatomae]SDI88834.1 hypothetical protein SAMN05444695_112102 [Rhodococcus triatomae]
MIRLAVVAAFLAVISYLLYRRLIRATGIPRPWSTVATTALIVLWASAVVGIGAGDVFETSWSRPAGFVGWVWLAAVLYLVLGITAIGAVSWLWHRARRTEPVDPSRRNVLRASSAALVIAAVGAAAYGVGEAARPQVVHVQVPLERLPDGFVGTRIALVTDLHVGPARGESFTREVVDLVNAQNPDLVALSGDLVDGTVAKIAPDLEPLGDLHAPLGVFGVSGNHEFYADDGGRWLDVWDTLGIRTLRNERVALSREGSVIDVAGVHDYSSEDPYRPDLPAALVDRDPSRFVLLLAHQPKQAPEAGELGVDLQVSGHTHGGQMWPLGYLVPLQQPSVTGLDTFGDAVLYTSRGVGTWGPPVRVATPPEITILELVRP